MRLLKLETLGFLQSNTILGAVKAPKWGRGGCINGVFFRFGNWYLSFQMWFDRSWHFHTNHP